MFATANVSVQIQLNVLRDGCIERMGIAVVYTIRYDTIR